MKRTWKSWCMQKNLTPHRKSQPNTSEVILRIEKLYSQELSQILIIDSYIVCHSKLYSKIKQSTLFDYELTLSSHQISYFIHSLLTLSSINI